MLRIIWNDVLLNIFTNYLTHFAFSSHLSSEEKAISRGIRVLIEEHLYKFLILGNYISGNQVKFPNMHRIKIIRWIFIFIYLFLALFKTFYLIIWFQTKFEYNKLGKPLNKGEVQRICIEDLQAVSSILSNKHFFGGEHGPNDLDCTVFAFM